MRRLIDGSILAVRLLGIGVVIIVLLSQVVSRVSGQPAPGQSNGEKLRVVLFTGGDDTAALTRLWIDAIHRWQADPRLGKVIRARIRNEGSEGIRHYPYVEVMGQDGKRAAGAPFGGNPDLTEQDVRSQISQVENLLTSLAPAPAASTVGGTSTSSTPSVGSTSSTSSTSSAETAAAAGTSGTTSPGAADSAGTGSPATAHQDNIDRLPATGIDMVVLYGLGASSLIMGVTLRRRSRLPVVHK